MRTSLIGLFLILTAAFAQAQAGTPYDCQFSTTFTATSTTTASYYNRGPAAPCIAWRLTYHTLNATAVSISLQGTANLPNGQPDPAGWTNLTTPTGSVNPAIGTAAGTIASCCDYYPWIRVIAGTFTGTAQTMSLTVLGYKGTSASRSTGGGVTGVTATSPIQATAGNAPVISLDTTKVAQKFFGTAAPGNIAGNLPGDLFTNTTAHTEYVCNAPSGTPANACTAVAAAGWLLLNTGGTVTGVTATSPIQASAGNAPVISLDTTKVPRKFFGTAAPTTVATNLPGDFFTDTTAHNEYVCNAPSGTAAPACTAVAAAEWLLLNPAGGITPPVTFTDIATPGNPAPASTTWYTKGGKLCSLSPGGAENCTGGGGGGGPTTQTAYNGGTGRIFGTTYQNLTTSPLYVNIGALCSGAIMILSVGPSTPLTPTTAGDAVNVVASSTWATTSGIVLPNYYYAMLGSCPQVVSSYLWIEWQ